MQERAPRPAGRPLMHQTWELVLFLNWRVPAERLRPLVPAGLAIDEFDGSAWVSVTPFTMWGIRASLLPPVPGLNRTHELNVRTYVRRDGVRGVWFFSLDAANPLIVWGARASFHLPYYRAAMTLMRTGDRVAYSSRRRAGPPASFDGSWTLGRHTGTAAEGSLEHFLIERYSLFAAANHGHYRADIDHAPWTLREVALERIDSTMLSPLGVIMPSEPAAAFAQADPLHVDVWGPSRLR